MILIEEKRITRRKDCPISTVSIKSGLGLKLCPRSGRPVANSRSHGHFMAQILCMFYFRNFYPISRRTNGFSIIVRLKLDGTRAETRFRLSPKRTSPFKSAVASVQSTADRRGVGISVSNAGYTTFRGSGRVLATHSIRQFPLHFPSRASPCAIRFQAHSTKSNPFILCRKKTSVYCAQHAECSKTTLLQSLLMLGGGTYHLLALVN
jgi:hypothetical protein